MISIIVPVYKVEKYIGPCVESILNSTYKDIELILVDDGSPDGSGDICDRFAQQDNRVRVIHKPNSGVSSARNEGLRAAQGDYIMFVDGDDRVHCQMIETLKTAIDSGDYDFSMVYAQKVSEDKPLEAKQYNLDEIETSELTADDFFDGIYLLQLYYTVIWNKLYKRSLVEGLSFANMVQAEDLEWNTRVSLRMHKAIVKKAQMYLYTVRKGSAMHGALSGRAAERIRTYKVCLDAIPEDNRAFRSKMLKLLYSMMLFFRRKFMDSANKGEINAICNELYRATIREFWHSDNSRLSILRSIIGYHCPGPYNFVTKMLEKTAGALK